jgi:AraC-like DNA-binding protein
MDSAAAAGHDPRSTPDGDEPVRAALRTTDLDEVRSFCRLLGYDGLRIRPMGNVDGLNFVSDGVRLGPISVGETRYGADVCVTSPDLETAYHVLMPLTGAVQVLQRGHMVSANPTQAAVLLPVGDIELNWSADCQLLSVEVDRAALEREVDAALDREVASPLPLGPSFPLGSGPGRSWLALIRLLLTELRGPDALIEQRPMARRWRELAVSGLALTVEHPYRDEPPSRRPRTVKRTLDAMHADPGYPFTSAELAAIAGVGVRVLQESFRQNLGMSPLTYLRRLRLDGVHTELRRADPWQASVSEVALRWGFTHLGRFAGAYRARYGQAPSQTLKERR